MSTIILHTLLSVVMISTKKGIPFITIGISGIVFVLFAASLVVASPSQVFAQGTNVTDPTGPSTTGNQTTVVMPLGSAGATSGAGYEPPEVTVSPGATVVWDNEDNALHTATSGISPDPDGKFDTGIVGANQQSEPIVMPTEPGEYPYFCTLHPFLTGMVVVQ